VIFGVSSMISKFCRLNPLSEFLPLLQNDENIFHALAISRLFELSRVLQLCRSMKAQAMCLAMKLGVRNLNFISTIRDSTSEAHR
jgi:hypothetical protein